jgi:hypothetical protein
MRSGEPYVRGPARGYGGRGGKRTVRIQDPAAAHELGIRLARADHFRGIPR